MQTYRPSKWVSQLGCILRSVRERVRVAQLQPHSQATSTLGLGMRLLDSLPVKGSTLKSAITLLGNSHVYMSLKATSMFTPCDLL